MNSENPNKYRITIVVPFHKLNGTEQFFSWAIQLCDYPSIKVIVAIDSEDKEIENRLLDLKAENLLTVMQKVGAPGLARNLALENLQSDYVMFADSDDFVYLDKVKRIIDEPQSADLIIASYEKFDIRTKKVTKFNSPTNVVEFAVEPALWRIIFKSSEIQNTRFTNFRMAEDQIFILSYLQGNRKITSSRERIYRYLTNQKDQLTNDPSALNELKHAVSYLDANNSLVSSSFGSYVYVKLNLSFGLLGIKNLLSKSISVSKIMQVFLVSLLKRKGSKFDSDTDLHWQINA